MNALTGGPWMIYDHYLQVRPWEPKFNPARATIDMVAVWIRLPWVFLEFYNKEALSFIGDRIGMSCDGNSNQFDFDKGPSSKGLQVSGPSNPIDPSHDPGAPPDKLEGVDSMEVGPLIGSPAVGGSIGTDLNNGEFVPKTQMS
ncbi:hypothetical protein K1719_038558 [Acacia pycnantha]|nr:hypothetical protein K1719_038558 [Acacia pycnantha]